ncbi:MAG: hypothetical protein IPK17_36000 [Chloroflexi bacterium]|uniref:hypothetical protein n=1 Tax=Candidatus Flexifilum breve TaxID=3140694 RepID=UPI003135DCFB|nr:hypothetical protein [Chloroflexota bacterium]
MLGAELTLQAMRSNGETVLPVGDDDAPLTAVFGGQSVLAQAAFLTYRQPCLINVRAL